MALLDTSIVTARPEYAIIDSCVPKVDSTVAQMLLFGVAVPLLVGERPKEGLAVMPAKDGLIPIFESPGVCERPIKCILL